MLVFFCFKQKTAYGMRISDWSSDVCSSDLQALFGMSDPLQFVPFSVVAILICLAALPVTASRMVQPELPPTPRLALVAQYRAAPAAASGALLSGLAMGAVGGLTPLYAVRQNGRASCRERVGRDG